MSDVPETAAPAPPDASVSARPTTAGGLLRQARQARGLHIAAVAAAIKVVPRKLELLESDQFDQLPDATFTRALAQAVCRTLKVDAAPVLALLPPPNGHRLERVAEGLKTPFRERPGRLAPREWASVASPALWLAALLVIAAVAVYLMPAGWLPMSKPAALAPADARVAVAPATEPVSIAAPPTAASMASPSMEAPAPALQPVAAAAEVAALAPVIGVLQLRTTAPSWIEVTDARGKTLLARLVQPGEDVGIDGVMPLKVRIGNAVGTQVVFRGRPLELAAFTRDNIARLELK